MIRILGVLTLLIASFSTYGAVVDPTTQPTFPLKCEAPTEREDTTPLAPSEIAGYNIYVGTTRGDYPEVIPVKDCNYNLDVTGYPDGVIYVVATTVDTDGRESVYSGSWYIRVARSTPVIVPIEPVVPVILTKPNAPVWLFN